MLTEFYCLVLLAVLCVAVALLAATAVALALSSWAARAGLDEWREEAATRLLRLLAEKGRRRKAERKLARWKGRALKWRTSE
jgi:hypothetical protein